MRYWTYSEIREKIEKDIDLEREVFVDVDELLGYVNEGIDICEGKIHSLYEDYFLTKAAITLVSGTDEYDLPTDIYANKIRALIYKNGSDVAVIRRAKNSRKLINYEVDAGTGATATAGNYEYLIYNPTAGQPKILLMPPVVESGPFLSIWYLRNANRLVEDTDICDIPEFVYFVIQYAKVKILFKEGHPSYPEEKARLDELEVEMLSTLAGMVPDEDNEIEPDFSFYEEMT